MRTKESKITYLSLPMENDYGSYYLSDCSIIHRSGERVRPGEYFVIYAKVAGNLETMELLLKEKDGIMYFPSPEIALKYINGLRKSASSK